MSESSTQNEPEYKLRRDWLGSARLSLQHFVIKMRQQWLVHPTIRSYITSQTTSTDSNTTPLRIADVAAGNCIWSIEVLSELPQVEITAFDISTESFPSQSTCPPQLKLETWDIFDTPPPQYQNYFDIVHVRYLLSIMFQGGRDTALKNFLLLLKPGGWIQWQDAAPPIIGPIQLDTLDFLPQDQWPLLGQFFNSADLTKRAGFYNNLDTLLRDEGSCEATEMFYVPRKRELLKYETDLALWLMDQTMNIVYGNTKDDEESEAKRKELQEAIDEEWSLARTGDRYWSYCVVCAIGRKPPS